MEWKNRIIGHGSKPASQFQAHPNNWRKHPARQRKAVRGSLDDLGWIDTVIENVRTGHLIDGHERVWQALDNGDAEVPYIQVDLSEAEEAQALLSLDAIAALAESDAEKIDALLREVKTDNADVMEFLADMAKDNGLYEEVQKDTEPQIDKAAELNQKWQVQTGDLWQIGEHRLLCGDCTDRAVVGRVMGGEKAGAVVTDPPYGQNQPGVPGDEPEALRGLIFGAVAAMPCENAIAVCFQSPRTFPCLLDLMREAGWKFERMLWMYKTAQCVSPWRGWLLKSEAILVFSIGNAEWVDFHPYAHDCYQLSEVSGELAENSGWHGSVKPLTVVRDIVSRVGGVVYDAFLGSGTTMIACQNLNRKCRAIEISPDYCAVILERMQTAFPELEIKKLDSVNT